MKRRSVIALALSGAICANGRVRGAEPARIAAVFSGSATERAHLVAAFSRGLAAAGLIEGRDFRLEIHFVDTDLGRLPSLAEAVVQSQPRVIVAAPTEPAAALHRVTKTIPIVLATGGDPVAAGLAASLARPGGNVIGLSSQGIDLLGKRWELLRELKPATTRVLALRGTAALAGAIEQREFDALVGGAGVAGRTVVIEAGGNLASLVTELDREPADAMFAFNDPVIFPLRRELTALAVARRLPLISPFREFTEGGALASYGASLTSNYQRAASYVDRILKGGDPATMPIEQPTNFELVLNQRTARALGIDIPPVVLAQADEVIE